MKKYTYLEIGNRLKELRKLKNNLSQKEFAEKIGVPFRTYQRYEAGERMPQRPVLSRVAELCGKTVDWLLGRDLASVIAEEKALYATKTAESATYWEMIREKYSSKVGIPVPENIRAFFEVVSFYNKHGIDVVNLIKGNTYTLKEQELIDMLVSILRGENEDNSKAIIENIKAFHKTRNINIPNELKKANDAG